jgi:hypothetical protein
MNAFNLYLKPVSEQQYEGCFPSLQIKQCKKEPCAWLTSVHLFTSLIPPVTAVGETALLVTFIGQHDTCAPRANLETCSKMA